MQIREQGRKVQLIRSTYDKEKKRNVAKLVGHFARYTDSKPSADVLALLTDEEKQQVQEWLDKRAEVKKIEDKNLSARLAPIQLSRLIEAVPEMKPEVANAVWEQIAILQKALKSAGHKKPRPAPGDKKDDRQMSISDQNAAS